MNLRQFCSLFDQNTLMDVLIGTLSTGAYSIKKSYMMENSIVIY